MMNVRSSEWQETDERVSKRHRQPFAWGDENDGGSDHRDYYDEIFYGRGNGIAVRDSWLKDIQPIFSGEDGEEMNVVIMTTGLNSSIRSLSQQLLQVKRRLWPAAELCAQTVGSWRTSAQKEFAQARRWCNPMEPLGEGQARGLNQMFMNRSAIKLANLDAMLGFCLTSSATNGNEPFLFVDLCGAPGGFSEYLMRRSQATQVSVSCRGYGMSLIGANEHGNGTPWKLSHLISSWNGSFQTNYRVCTGFDGTGDIYKWDNVQSLMQDIQNELASAKLSPHAKVHLVVADGGFDAQRDSEYQEELAQKLVLCEMAAAISLLRVEGTFVVKMFGFQTSTIRTAMKSLFDMFRELQIFKPISSRPASSERYVVFSGFRGLPNNWDGESWLNLVLLGKASTHPVPFYSNLVSKLDQCDLDMLTLNLKACFAILSTLERKTATIQAGGTDGWNEERPPVNVHAYKAAWGLHDI